MIRTLSYIGFRSPAADEWRTFGPEILGIQLADDAADGGVRLRVDDAAWRIAVHPGTQDDLAYLGWDVGDAAGLADVSERVRAAGLTVTADDDLATARQVAAAAWFTDPFGFRHELAYGLTTGPTFVPGRPMASGFVTGDQGVGHLVLIVPDLARGESFFTDTLGLRVSDTIEAGVTLRFFHCAGHAARHHTVAIGAAPGLVGMHHLMLEVHSIDDVGHALDLINERGISHPRWDAIPTTS